jgi:hypothetical protein
MKMTMTTTTTTTDIFLRLYIEGQETAEERYQKWFAGITFQTRPVGVEAEVHYSNFPLKEFRDKINQTL